MTQEEKIIATAFTGKMFVDCSEMGSLYEYMEKKVGHGVIDLMLASKEFWEELHKACEQDFIDMVSKEQPSLPLPSNLDEAAIQAHIRLEDGEGLSFLNIFKAGAQWMAGQGETVEGVFKAGDPGYPDVRMGEQYSIEHILCKPCGIEPGDKVIVQIRKK